MALETLKDVTEIDGFEVAQQARSYEDGKHIAINHDTNVISFHIQNGSIKENGVNGCQVDTLIAAAALILRGLNEKFPCDENSHAITHLGSALALLKQRKADREARGVEGTNNA